MDSRYQSGRTKRDRSTRPLRFREIEGQPKPNSWVFPWAGTGLFWVTPRNLQKLQTNRHTNLGSLHSRRPEGSGVPHPLTAEASVTVCLRRSATGSFFPRKSVCCSRRATECAPPRMTQTERKMRDDGTRRARRGRTARGVTPDPATQPRVVDARTQIFNQRGRAT